MTPPQWWVRFLARLRPSAVRRGRPLAFLSLEILPHRDSPSSLDVGGFVPLAAPLPDSVVSPAPPVERAFASAAPTLSPFVLNTVKMVTPVAHPPGPKSAETHPETPFSTWSNRPQQFASPPSLTHQPNHPEGKPAPPDVPAVANPPRPASASSESPVYVALVAPSSFDCWRVMIGFRPATQPEAPPAAVVVPPAVTVPPAFDVTPTPVVVAPPLPPQPAVRPWQGLPPDHVIVPPPVSPAVPLPAPGVPPPSAISPEVPPAPSPTTVVPVASAVSLPLAADAPLFRVSGTPIAASSLSVSYTLAAHSAGGTTAARGSVTLTGGSVATLTPPAALVGHSPDVLTVLVGTRSATLFVVSPQQVSDPVLIAAHRGGRSAEAFAVLAARHGPTVSRAVQRVVRNRTDAADVSQFVFLELAKTRAQFPGTLAGWLRAVSRNAALAFLRAKRRRLMRERQAARAEAEIPPPAPLDEMLVAALHRLPADLGQAVRLRYLEGYTQLEAAALAGVPRGTLSRRAAEGVRLLRQMLMAGEQTDDQRHFE